MIGSNVTGPAREVFVHRALVDQAKRGDEEAFDALARMVGDRCMAIAHRILRDADMAEICPKGGGLLRRPFRLDHLVGREFLDEFAA